MTIYPEPSPGNQPSTDPQITSFTPTSRLLEFLEIFKGGIFTSDQIEQVNDGRLDYITGDVLLQSYQQSHQLVQVRIQTKEEGIFTLTSNREVALNPNVFKTLGNTYLINRPREIWISNLDNSDFQEIFNEAAQFRQRVACVYSRITGEIVLLIIINLLDTSYRKYYTGTGVGEDSRGPHLPPPPPWS